MSAKKTGGTGARQKAKNQAMAAAMKAAGTQRSTCNCPLCHNLVAIKRLDVHIATCRVG